MAFRRFILDLLGTTDPVDVGEIRYKSGTGFRARDGGGVFTISAGGGSGTVAGVLGTAPIASDGNSATPTISLNDAGVSYAKIQNISATDKVLGRVTAGAGSAEEIACTAAGRALIDDASAADQRTTLGLGTIATVADAPSDGSTYGRNNGAWAVAGGGSVGNLRVPTSDVALNADVSLIVSDYYEITSLLTLDINATATLEII